MSESSIPEEKSSNLSPLTSDSLWELNAEDIHVFEEIGRGSFGVVHKAQLHGMEVAVKKLAAAAPPALQQIAARMLRREVKTLSRCRHKNVVRLIGACSFPPMLVLEYASKGTLRELLVSHKYENVEFPSSLKIELVRGICDGMTMLHSQDILHLDLKPENILIMEDGTPVVADFGLAIAMQATRTSGGASTKGGRGTMQYKAPEHFTGDSDSDDSDEETKSSPKVTYDKPADVYSFAMMFWEIFSGEVPFASKTEGRIIAMHLKAASNPEKIKRPSVDDLPSEIIPIIEQCWSQDSGTRPTFLELKELLKQLPLFIKNALNTPGFWDVFISHTQRNPEGKLLALDFHTTMKDKDKSTWLDVRMDNMSMAAMEEGVKNSKCVVAIITDSCATSADDPKKGGPEQNAYFNRWMCQQELRWAIQYNIPIQPVIRAEDKKKIGEFIEMAPDDLKFLGGIDWKHLDRGNKRFFDLGVEMVIEGMDELIKKSQRKKEEGSDIETKSTSSIDRNKIEMEIRAQIEKEYEVKSAVEDAKLFGFEEGYDVKILIEEVVCVGKIVAITMTGLLVQLESGVTKKYDDVTKLATDVDEATSKADAEKVSQQEAERLAEERALNREQQKQERIVKAEKQAMARRVAAEQSLKKERERVTSSATIDIEIETEPVVELESAGRKPAAEWLTKHKALRIVMTEELKEIFQIACIDTAYDLARANTDTLNKMVGAMKKPDQRRWNKCGEVELQILRDQEDEENRKQAVLEEQIRQRKESIAKQKYDMEEKEKERLQELEQEEKNDMEKIMEDDLQNLLNTASLAYNTVAEWILATGMNSLVKQRLDDEGYVTMEDLREIQEEEVDAIVKIASNFDQQIMSRIYTAFRGVRFVHVGEVRKNKWTCCNTKMVATSSCYCMMEEAASLVKKVGLKLSSRKEIGKIGRIVEAEDGDITKFQGDVVGVTPQNITTGTVEKLIVRFSKSKVETMTLEELRLMVDNHVLKINAKERRVSVGKSIRILCGEDVYDGKVNRIENGQIAMNIDGSERTFTLEKTVELMALGIQQDAAEKTEEREGKRIEREERRDERKRKWDEGAVNRQSCLIFCCGGIFCLAILGLIVYWLGWVYNWNNHWGWMFVPWCVIGTIVHGLLFSDERNGSSSSIAISYLAFLWFTSLVLLIIGSGSNSNPAIITGAVFTGLPVPIGIMYGLALCLSEAEGRNALFYGCIGLISLTIVGFSIYGLVIFPWTDYWGWVFVGIFIVGTGIISAISEGDGGAILFYVLGMMFLLFLLGCWTRSIPAIVTGSVLGCLLFCAVAAFKN